MRRTRGWYAEATNSGFMVRSNNRSLCSEMSDGPLVETIKKSKVALVIEARFQILTRGWHIFAQSPGPNAAHE